MIIWWQRLGLTVLLSCSLSGAAFGQNNTDRNSTDHNHAGQYHNEHTHDMDHKHGMSHGADSSLIPEEAGQSAFAAIAEIVAILEADPDTDWSGVSINALREHLLDMNLITLSSEVQTQMLDEQRIQFQISGKGRTVTAIQTMLPMHASMVSSTTGWEVEVIQESDGVTLTIIPDTKESMTKLKALGFYGFMTIGAHHQIHHLRMATGQGH